MFVLSKLVGFVLLPSNLIGVLAVLGLFAFLLRWRRLGRFLIVLAVLLIAVGGWSPAGPAALKLLENRFPQPELTGPVAGIVMLGGAVNTHLTADRDQATLNDAGERVTAVAGLAGRFPDARILLSGGASDVAAEPLTESAIARNVLVAMGIPAARIELEERSRNTCENARESAAIARPKAGDRWLLVTSASHMPRAVACFRAAGFAIVPYPVDYRTGSAFPLQSIADGLAALDLAAHEWVGLAGYRLAGRTTEFFPSP